MLIEVVGNDTKPLWIESTKIVGVSAKPPAMCIINVACGEKTEEWHLCEDADRVRRAVDDANVLEEASSFGLYRKLVKRVTDLIEADPHQWSKRPCATCRTISVIVGYEFGCMTLVDAPRAAEAGKESRDGKN